MISKCLLEAILPINKNILIYSIFYSLLIKFKNIHMIIKLNI